MGEDNMIQNETVTLLQQIKEQNKKKLFYTRSITILFLIICVILLSIVPSIISTLNTTRNTMAHLDQTITNMDEALDSALELADTSATGMQNALEKINSIDIETLNQAIEDLNTVVKPMAGLFGKFQ